MFPKNRNDEQLIADYLNGDEESFKHLVKCYLKPIYSFVYRYVGNSQDAEDVTQKVFVKAWRNLKKPALHRIYSGAGFDPHRGSFKTWIFAIAKNTSIDWLRKKKAVPFSNFENEEGKNTFTETLADPSPLPNEIMEQKDIAQILSSTMEKLLPKYRMVLFLRYNDHFNFREIAEILEEPLNTVKSRHRRALIMLRKILQD